MYNDHQNRQRRSCLDLPYFARLLTELGLKSISDQELELLVHEEQNKFKCGIVLPVLLGEQVELTS